MANVPCLVCTKSYDGTTHCSVTVCRACAMFFKRYATRTIPICKIKNQCPMEITGNYLCTACRYNKCLEIGLKRQANVRSSQPTNNQEKSIAILKNNEQRVLNSDFRLELSALVIETMPILKQFCYNYAINSNSKKEFEKEILHTQGEELVQIHGYRKWGIMSLTIEQNTAIQERSMSDFKEFLNGAFLAFRYMDPIAQDAVFHTIMFLFFDLFASFKTMKIFNDVNTSKFVCTETMFADLDNLEYFLEKDRFSNPMDHKAVEDYLQTTWKVFLKTTHKLMHRIKLTDVEYIAVCALTMWDEDHFVFLPHLEEMSENHRYLIYKELDYYYRNIIHLDNYVERIMNIKELLRTIKRNIIILKESLHFLRAFNYYEGHEEEWSHSERVMNALNALNI